MDNFVCYFTDEDIPITLVRNKWLFEGKVDSIRIYFKTFENPEEHTLCNSMVETNKIHTIFHHLKTTHFDFKIDLEFKIIPMKSYIRDYWFPSYIEITKIHFDE